MANDPAVNPSHYKGKTLEVIDILENWNLQRNGYLMQAVAYILRHHRKGTPAQDLQKSCWYLDRCRTHGGGTPGTPTDYGRVYDSEAVCEDLGLPVIPFASLLDDIRYASRMRAPAYEWKLKGIVNNLRRYAENAYPPEPIAPTFMEYPECSTSLVLKYADADQLRMFGVLANQAPE